MSAPTDPAEWVEAAALRHPERCFLRTAAGAVWTYRALRTESRQFAAALAQLGVNPGDRVAVQVDKSAAAVFLYVACLRLGAVFVPINVANTASEVDYFLRDSQPRVAVVRPEDHAALEPVARRAGVLHVETLGADGHGTMSARARASIVPAGVPAPLPQIPRVNAPAAIVYTSGTTGRSKGAILTRHNLLSNAGTLAAEWRFTERDVLLHVLPLYHVHGLFVAINTVLASASALLLLPKFDAALALEHLPAVTVFMGVPTHYTRLLQERLLDRERTAGVRLFVSGSAPLLVDTHREFLQRTGHTILERYGMTETLMNTSNPYAGERRPGSVGPPLPGIALRVAGAEPIGTLEVNGPNVFAGYWRDPDKTRDAFTADGWFKTGDLGRIDAEGYVSIVGREKDLVISGGYNVYPKEVEMELDALAGVLESAVFGAPHPDFGEGVTAAVVPQPGALLSEPELLGALRTRLAAYKVPKRVLLVPELPRNAIGKVQKNVLRATYESLYRGR
jgi:malonyl-CoA/methylmalonyl-CoA synthetase